MKKISLIIIGLTLSLTLLPSNSSAKILDECKLKPFEDLKTDEAISDLDFRVAFEKAANQYHEYVNCVFNKASESVLKSAGGDPKNLLSPNEACLSDKNPQKMKELLKDSSPENLLPALLKAYENYAAYLKNLQSLLARQPELNTGSSNPFEDFINRQQKLKLMAENELEHAIVALDSAFIALKELRKAFVMHLHFQCMLKNLEFYQRALANLRSVVTLLPPLFHNASTQ